MGKFPSEGPRKTCLAHSGSLLTVIPVWHCRLVICARAVGGLYPSYPSPIQWHMPIHQQKIHNMAIAQLKASPDPGGGLARIFLAICPPQPIRAAFTRYENTCTWNRGVALVSLAKFHITLYFIGEVERQRLAEIRQALKIPFTPFDLKLDRPELWARGITVLRPSELPGEFLTLQDSLSKTGP